MKKQLKTLIILVVVVALLAALYFVVRAIQARRQAEEEAAAAQDEVVYLYEPDTITAVSYTHLDVYKRQVLVSPRRMGRSR